MNQMKSFKYLSSLKTQKSIKEELQKQQFFEELLQQIQEQLGKEEHQFLMNYLLTERCRQKNQTQQTHIDQQKALFRIRNSIQKECQMPLQQIQQDVFKSNRNMRKKRFITQTLPRTKLYRANISITNIKKQTRAQRKDIQTILNSFQNNSLNMENGSSFKESGHSSANIKKFTKLHPYISKQRQKHQENSLLKNQKLMKIYKNNFLNNLFEGHAHQDNHSSSICLHQKKNSDNRQLYHQFMGKNIQHELRMNCITSIKFQRQPKRVQTATLMKSHPNYARKF